MSTSAANSASKSPLSTQNQDRLRTFFEGHSTNAHPTRWDDLWKAGDFLPWDRGSANPALIDTLNARPPWLGAPTKPDGSRKRALVPGCGKGYDLVLFAAHEYDAYGIEISENAAKAAENWLKNPEEGNEGEYKTREEKVGKGVTKMLIGDFFQDDWATEAGGIGEGFDVIYDNTFLSALPPSLRAEWALRMTHLLAPDGILICLEFPTHKPAKTGGPPWSLPSVVYTELFKRPGEGIEYDGEGNVMESGRPESEKALTRIAFWKPERTHQVGIINGDVKDRVSVWKHK
ncbi:S-adenosyl-L-methionine-dependent methyltransferase [Sporormia fimetaria CBS 119925]|uniref:S-adenosyl-L-methionine-dependent methyltransferase n=1 Tax=Sporormia fimetaria CBS 119925 TaxID=1340428 RepID=A0A6A6VGT9_9PLEO|nr:S-adenosyl-L-methionine-dependent methyltransferase [Sporormia fimetaria CBS 119925]